MANRPVSDNSANTQKHSDYIAPSYQQNLEARVLGKDSADKSEPGNETFCIGGSKILISRWLFVLSYLTF